MKYSQTERSLRMKQQVTRDDIQFMRHCFRLAQASLQQGDKPFGALIVHDGKIIAQSGNKSKIIVHNHAELLVMQQVAEEWQSNDLSSCTLYTSCEPCPMCAFMAREYMIGRIVFSVRSPIMGGYTKFGVLTDTGLSEQCPEFFGDVPEIVPHVLEDEGEKVFAGTELEYLFGRRCEKRLALTKAAQDILNNPYNTEYLQKLINVLGLTRQAVLEAYLKYDMDIDSYGNEIYESLAMRFAMYLHLFLSGSWHQERQNVVTGFLNKINPSSIVDMGFGIPSNYIFTYVQPAISLGEQPVVSLKLVDLYESAIVFAQAVLNHSSSRAGDWRQYVSFEVLDMNQHPYPGDFACYMFLDSLEHVQKPAEYLRMLVEQSPDDAHFIFSLPVCGPVPVHTVDFPTDAAVLSWLQEAGLCVDEVEVVEINPDVDIFIDLDEFPLHNLLILCSKR